jgi:nucleoid DNA-binding protein
MFNPIKSRLLLERELIMNKGDFVGAVADAADMTKADAERAVEAMFKVVKKALKSGDSISLVGFGTFSVRKYGEKQSVTMSAAEVEARGLDLLRKLDDARRPVLAAFAVAYAALARAESLVELVAAGKRDPMSLILAAQEVAKTAEAVYAAVRGAK